MIFKRQSDLSGSPRMSLVVAGKNRSRKMGGREAMKWYQLARLQLDDTAELKVRCCDTREHSSMGSG